MKVYRVGKTRYANDLTGEGAKLHGGRWNHVMTACIYTSESRALALLEYTVNVNIEDIPRALSITTFEIPDDIAIQELTMLQLPGDWKEFPAPSSTKDFGTELLDGANFPVIKIPSVVVSQEFNFLFNPKHPDFRKVKIVDVRDLVYDVRIKST
ncbi:RES family NAD+ phosphorylase [Chitinophagaceae bacterium 26-R-25]|nr:RES family NAD+ phosphorylase [Chitinophagaceae bacterium 26-R-25]